MPTHVQITATLLNDAAGFFRRMADSNAQIRQKMTDNANAFEQMATIVTDAPTAPAGPTNNAGHAADMLMNAAVFFRSIADMNEPIQEQMMRTADVYDDIAKLVKEDPFGEMPE